jgi:hypothetical protein
MKNLTSFHKAVVSAVLAITPAAQALEVHEWGTFTILSNSKGEAIDWYQPFSDIAQLPPFTYNPTMMKQRITNARVRMETPVIYFYPKEETTVNVKVSFRNGHITERYPAPQGQSGQSQSIIGWNGLHANLTACSAVAPSSETIFQRRIAEFSSRNQPTITHWTGTLLPPDHKDAAAIPAASGPAGEHYAAARAVPDAWLFRSETEGSMAKQVEKFIFYRGAGQDVPPYLAKMTADRGVTFYNHSQSANTFLIALQVRDGKAYWQQMPHISAPGTDAPRDSSITFGDEGMSLEQADRELSAVFLKELIARGLTKAEALAMIATWNHTWFNEPGQRVFTIVDRTWVDSTLPLAIAPEPEKIERVFVARYELLSPAAEQILTALMEQPVTAESKKEYAALQLGRFANGAAESVANSIKFKSLQRLNSLRE